MENIRNIALLGHASSGKTSLSEAILYTAGITSRLGRIDDGTTTSDYHDDEISRKFSISSSLMHCEWNKCKFNLLDAPGYLDFIGEAKAVTRVADLGLILVHAQSGAEVGTDLVFKYAALDQLPICFVINLLDKEHADFEKSLESLRHSFGKQVVALQIPVNQGIDFDRIVDLVLNKMLIYSKDGKSTVTEAEIPAELKEKISSIRDELIEYIAESDDALLEKYFEAGELSEDDLKKGLKKAILSRSLFPVLTTSAYDNIGVSRILDFIVGFGPNPGDRSPVSGILNNKETKRAINDDEPAALFIFKTLSEMHVGELSMFKVMSGIVDGGTDLQNVQTHQVERLNQLFCVNGKDKKEIAHLHSGDIGAVVKLKKTHTNDTLADSKSQIAFPAVIYPAPVIQVAVDPRSRADEDKINAGLQTLVDEDPMFTFKYEPELKQTIVSGQGELHLKIMLERLKQRFNVEVDQKPPRIPYRETITKRGDSKYRHKKQTGGAGQFAEVWMYVEPLPSGSGFEFSNTLVGQNVDRVFVPSVEKGVKAACEEGILAGYHVADVKATFYDGKMHPVDSKDIAFQIAGKGAFKECFMNAGPILLEPIYDVEIVIPEDFMGDVMGDISVRRGKIQGIDSEGNFQKINAKIPLAELYRYGTALRSMTQGRGLHRQKFSHYEPMPREHQEKVVAESNTKKEE
jgi:elongation factor G